MITSSFLELLMIAGAVGLGFMICFWWIKLRRNRLSRGSNVIFVDETAAYGVSAENVIRPSNENYDSQDTTQKPSAQNVNRGLNEYPSSQATAYGLPDLPKSDYKVKSPYDELGDLVQPKTEEDPDDEYEDYNQCTDAIESI
ncbi:uncharacterized protein LOC125661374 [Ostrea edulis]|uniref:uncharacterized protein LOC125661374 n=1 Tax=Ostrea edulis TaxID=37623 RepID=UPI00209413F2|nr:uncharacterized protein LOC125661374 [Ostrea edulis]